jgi:hypothetical protein
MPPPWGHMLLVLMISFEKAIPPLSIPYLNKIAANQKWVLLHETPDNVSANGLKRKNTAKEISSNILYPHGGCCAHALTRVTTVTLKEDETIGDIYTTHYVFAIVRSRGESGGCALGSLSGY